MAQPVVTEHPAAAGQSARPDPEVEVVSVQSGLEKDAFIRLQWQINKGDRNWVPPLLMERHEFLDPAKNPFFKHSEVGLYLARRGGEPVGRIAAVNDRNFNAFHGSKAAYFGLYESVNDPGVAAALFNAAKAWARWRGLDSMIGPMNLSTNYDCGLLVDGFDTPPYLLMPHNPYYYADLFGACGLKKSKDLYAFERTAAEPPPEKFASIAEKVRKREGLLVRPVNLKDFEGEVTRLKAVYNAAWEKNWGFVPMTDAEFDKLARDLKQIVAPGLCLVAEAHGEPVAFSLTVPDFNQALKHVDGRLTTFGLPLGLAKLVYYSRKIDRVRLMALGVIERYRKRGIDAVLVVETIRRAQELGYRGGEISWTLEDNDLINRAIEACGCVRHKTYRIFETPVE